MLIHPSASMLEEAHHKFAIENFKNNHYFFASLNHWVSKSFLSQKPFAVNFVGMIWQSTTLEASFSLHCTFAARSLLVLILSSPQIRVKVEVVARVQGDLDGAVGLLDRMLHTDIHGLHKLEQ